VDGFSLNPWGACEERFCAFAATQEGGVAIEGNAPVDNSNSPLTNLPREASAFTVLGEEPPQDLDSPSAVRLWVHRLSMLLFVFFCAVLGVVLVVFPWKDEWTNNSLVIGYPLLQRFLGSGFVRGMCSGLGLLDIWIGFWEAIHYHE
jgi:hypothetical protein